MSEATPKSLVHARNVIEQSDCEIVSSIENRLIELFDDLRAPLLRYLSSFPLPVHDAEDVVQDAFLSLYQQMRRGRSIQELRGWLFRATHNLALKKRLRSRKELENGGSLELAGSFASDSAMNPEDLLVFHRRQERVQAVLNALPEQDRWCLYLRSEGLRYRQIAEILNMSLGSVSNSLERALARIARATER